MVTKVRDFRKVQESKKKPEERSSFFDSGTLSMIEVLSGRPEEDEDLLPENTILIERIRMKVMLKIASLSCSMRHVDYLYHLEEYLDAIR